MNNAFKKVFYTITTLYVCMSGYVLQEDILEHAFVSTIPLLYNCLITKHYMHNYLMPFSCILVLQVCVLLLFVQVYWTCISLCTTPNCKMEN